MRNIRTKKERAVRVEDRKEPIADRSVLMRLNKFIAKKEVLITISITIYVVIFALFNYIINIFSTLLSMNFDEIFDKNNYQILFSFKNIFIFHKELVFIYICFAIFLLVIDLWLAYQISTSNKDYNVGQKGTARFQTFEEIQAAYKEIAERDNVWNGYGGLLVSRYKDKLYIDEEPGHAIILGTTRSGKDEMFVIPMIDLNSRATVQSSFITIDIKQETGSMSRKTLEDRGYLVLFFNLTDPLMGMGYNPLSAILIKYKENQTANAQQMARSFAYSVFCSDTSGMNDSEKEFWSTTATDLLAAHIIALCEDCLAMDKRENAVREYNFIKAQIAFSTLDENTKDEIRNKAQNLSPDELVGEKYIPDNFIFIPSHKHEDKINMFSIYNIFSMLSEITVDKMGKTALDLFFKSRPRSDKSRLFYTSINIASHKTKASIYSMMISKLSLFVGDNIVKMTAKSSIDLRDIGFGDQPIAIFISAPEYDKSNRFIATTFIRQIYYVLTEEAVHTKGRKCTRPVRFFLNELGNFPAIEALDEFASLGAGRNLFLYLFLQSYEQLDKIYGKAAATIKQNCHNHIYIKTTDEKTAKAFSENLGNETITNINRIGKKIEIGKTFTETYEEASLLTSTQLLELLAGECVIRPSMKRKTLDGKDCRPRPIFNTGETRFKYRYQYLADEFPDNVMLSDVVKESNADIDIDEITFDIISYFEQHIRCKDTTINQVYYMPDFKEFVDMLISDGLFDIEIGQISNINVVDLYNFITNLDLPEERKNEYMDFIKSENEKIRKMYREITIKVNQQ